MLAVRWDKARALEKRVRKGVFRPYVYAEGTAKIETRCQTCGKEGMNRIYVVHTEKAGFPKLAKKCPFCKVTNPLSLKESKILRS